MEENRNKVFEVQYSNTMINSLRIDAIISERDVYNTKLPLQRPIAWGKELMSRLIETIITGCTDVPVIEINMRNGEKRVMDGVNRIESVFHFYDNKFKLNNDTMSIKLHDVNDGKDKIYELANKTFIELDKHVQDLFLSRSLNFTIMYNASDEKEAETMVRHNSGISITGVLKARMKNYSSNTQEWCETIVNNNNFFLNKLNVTELKKKRGVAMSLLYALLFIKSDIKEDVSLASDKNYEKIGDLVCSSEYVTDELLSKIESVLGFMDKVIPAKQKWINKTNFISIYMLFEKLHDEGLQEEYYNTQETCMELFSILNDYMYKNGNEFYKVKGTDKAAILKKYEIIYNYCNNYNKEKLA